MLLLVTLCLIAVNMRATITGVGPLLEQMSEHTGMRVAALSGLASVPLVTWALVSPFAHPVARRFGFDKTVSAALVLLTIGSVVRSLPGPIGSIWIGTALIGVGLAIANVLLPAVVKRSFGSRVPVVTALYTSILAGCGAIASGIVVPISHLPAIDGTPWGWRVALLATSAALPVALALWIVASRDTARTTAPAPPAPRRSGIWRDRLAWQVAAYFGVQASSFYVVLTWLAPLSRSVGRSESLAGFDVMMCQVTSVAGLLLLPLLLRGSAERFVPAVLPSLGIAGVCGLLCAPEGVLWWGMLFGFSSGASIAMSLTLMASRARDAMSSSALSGMAQSVGYAFAAFPPVIVGVLYEATGGWKAPLLLILGLLVAQALLGPLVGRNRYVL